MGADAILLVLRLLSIAVLYAFLLTLLFLIRRDLRRAASATPPATARPAEVDQLLGDATRAREHLGWHPEVTFPGLVAMMVDADLERHLRALPTDGSAAREVHPLISR